MLLIFCSTTKLSNATSYLVTPSQRKRFPPESKFQIGLKCLKYYLPLETSSIHQPFKASISTAKRQNIDRYGCTSRICEAIEQKSPPPRAKIGEFLSSVFDSKTANSQGRIQECRCLGAVTVTDYPKIADAKAPVAPNLNTPLKVEHRLSFQHWSVMNTSCGISRSLFA